MPSLSWISHAFLFLLGVAIVLFLGIHLALYFYQERLLFYPEKLPADHPLVGVQLPGEKAIEELWISGDGVRLNALRFRAKHPKGVIVYFHGNAGSLKDWSSVAEDLRGHGYDVLIYDYRGYGKSEGSITSESEFVGDARRVLAEAKKEYSDDRIILFGRSMGTGLAMALAAESNPKLVILETPFASLTRLARKQFPFLIPMVLKYPFASDALAPKVTAPVAIFHGTDDEIVPFSSGEALRDAFKRPVRFFAIEGGHHNDLESYPAYQKALTEVLAAP